MTLYFNNGKTLKITSAAMMRKAAYALDNGIASSWCKECGGTVKVEPDANTGYCPHCKISRPVINPCTLCYFK